MPRPRPHYHVLRLSPALVRVTLLACGLCCVSAGITRAGDQFQRCDPFMLRAPEIRLSEPARDSGFTSLSSSFATPRWTGSRRQRSDGPGTNGPSAQWTQLEPLELGSATSNLVVDRPRDRLVLFGGYSFFRNVNHVWTRPLADDRAPWERLDVPGVHPGRYTAPTSVYDPVRERLVVLGGYPGDGVWALTLSGAPQWTRLSFSDPGQGGIMNGTVAIYDPNGDRVVVVAGGTSQGSSVWAFALGDASGWTLLQPEGTPPSQRDNYHAVYDRNRRRMLVFSGFAAGAPADLWALSLGDTLAWESIATSGDVPLGTYQGAAAFDPVHDRMVIADGIVQIDPGGATDDAWVLQFGGVPTWRHILPDVHPVARNGPCMAYDEQRDRFVMFGGGIGDTWSLSIGQDTTWTLIEPEVTGPYPLYNLGVVHDARRHRFLRFGGHIHYFVHGTPQPGESDELWGLTIDRFERWTLEQRGPPPAMAGMSLLLDPGADRLITLGGYSMRNGVWGMLEQLDLGDTTSWRPLPVAGDEPPARRMQSAAADPVRQRVVMFGGSTPTGALGDGWLLDLHEPASWTRLDSLSLAPSPRYGSGMVYDPINDRMLLFGGRDDTGHTYAETWQLSLAGVPTWSPLALPTSPPARSHAAIVYDSIRQRVALFGGRSPDGVPLRDTWYLPLAEGATWVLADSSDVLPRERWAAAAAFDPEHDRMVVLNGTYDPCGPQEGIVVWDNWEMRSLDAVPEPLTLASVERHPQSVALEWHGSASGRFTGSIARRTEASPWRRLAAVIQSADGSVRFADTSVSPGVRYAYRITWSEGAVASTTEPVWTEVPALHLALERIQNPSHAGIRASFSLPDAGPGRLDVLDVSGRTVATRDVGDLGPGDHTLQLAAPGELVPGRYWVRLVRGSRTRTTGVVVLR